MVVFFCIPIFIVLGFAYGEKRFDFHELDLRGPNGDDWDLSFLETAPKKAAKNLKKTTTTTTTQQPSSKQQTITMAIQYPTALYALNSTTYSNPKDQPASYKARPIMTIHGLWINQALKIKPTTTVPPVTPPNLHEMERVWPNVELSNSNANFWAREFLKHHDTLNQKEYFNKALRLFEKINKNLHVFPNVFPNEKILDDVTYKCAFLNHYLGSINNVFEHPTLVCDNTTNVFKELRVCYDQYDKRKQCKNQGTTCDHNQNIIFLKPL